MSTILDIQNSLDGQFSVKPIEFKAILGRADGLVVAGTNMVYATLYNGNVIEIFNNKVPNIPFRKIWIGYTSKSDPLLQVLRLENVYDVVSEPSVAPHKDTHSWFGYDPIEVSQEQFMNLLPRAIGGLVVRVYAGYYTINGIYHVIDTKNVDLSAETITDGAEWVNAEIDAAGTITFQHGANKDDRRLLLPEDIPNVITGNKLLFSAKIYAGQSDFIQNRADTDIFDPRFTGISSGGILLDDLKFVISDADGNLTTSAKFYYDPVNNLVYFGGPDGQPIAPNNSNVLTLLAKGNNTQSVLESWAWGDNALTYPLDFAYVSAGTRDTPAALGSGRILRSIAASTFDGVNWIANSIVRMVYRTAEAITTIAQGAYISWEGTKIGTTVKIEFGSLKETGFDVPVNSTYNINGIPHQHNTYIFYDFT